MAGETGEMTASAVKRLVAIKLAKASKWEELQRLVESDPSAAQQLDTYHMLPLHWACTEPHSVGDNVLMALLKAYPQAAGCPNSAKLAPLQIAIKAQASIEWLQALLASCPEAVLMKTPTGENIVQLARKASIPSQSIRLLEEMYVHECQQNGIPCDIVVDSQGGVPARTHDHVQSEAEEAPSIRATNEGFAFTRTASMGGDMRRMGGTTKVRSFSENDYQMAIPEALPREAPAAFGSTTGVRQSSAYPGMPISKPMPYQMSAKLSSRTVVSLPPRWANAPNCHICSSKFGTFRKRHHCRNCGQSICKDHSARERLRLPHYGLPDRYRVCTVCHAALQNAPPKMLEPGQAHVAPFAVHQRADDIATRISMASTPQYSLDRHVSAPTRVTEPKRTGTEPNYEGMRQQLATLQRKLSQLKVEGGGSTSTPQLRNQLGDGHEQHAKGISGKPIVHVAPSMKPTSVQQRDISSQNSMIKLPVDSSRRAEEDLAGLSTASTFKTSEYFDLSSDSFAASNAMLVTNGISGRGSGGSKGDGSGDDDDDDDDDDGTHKPEVEVLVNLGHLMMSKGSYSAAVQAYARAVEICPDNALLYSYLAKALYSDENLDEAVIALDKSLSLQPSAANSTLLGKILFEKGDHERAIEAYQQSLQIQQDKE